MSDLIRTITFSNGAYIKLFGNLKGYEILTYEVSRDKGCGAMLEDYAIYLLESNKLSKSINLSKTEKEKIDYKTNKLHDAIVKFCNNKMLEQIKKEKIILDIMELKLELKKSTSIECYISVRYNLNYDDTCNYIELANERLYK